ncbi:hypothetical protein LTR10_018340 [Elasticomyces elasticus]|uniref:L-ornithine N(5)-oxygenase n=1 Tax=Exophiala sideris TaxID=1016849 RepID=A0ABR0JMX3_9EURO|nr:hypothetical protein LTR10_018340 [Elasticomyces elasticus]KAK5024191.1 hypothetical protein LTR13_010974 [Exophiala sideris]KAK5036730.1 hypothetical protein LTS07_002458 [Exophiala sideris]KAK5067114.1 hypothetical protein LTR69_002463 [Exophiala sideris]KAK5186712.1 hypothetical protein LTR44_000718 [Eurotiomycetes sp. CCFEE 6388]
MSPKSHYLPSYQPFVANASTLQDPELPMSNENLTKAAVVIIGGGISGMCIAIDLLVNRKVKNFVILEQSGGFGGTWRDNKFPGCCCDVFSVLYSYSFAQNPQWSRRYPGQEEILNYLTDVAQKYGLYKYTRFHTTVDAASWNDKNMKWETTVTVGGGKEAEFSSSYKITSDFVVAATGQLNKPKGIKVQGYGDFQGKIMHSARWDWSYDMKGKRIAIIGTGATTAQIAPEVAKVASHLTICQRTPAWVIPRHDSNTDQWTRLLYTYFPPARWRGRAEAMDFRESFHSAVTKADSNYAELMRTMNYNLLREQLSDRPDLWEKLTPSYSPGCKRSVISDDYYPTLGRKNVSLVTHKIERFTTEGIKFAGHDSADKFDLIVLATGFDTFSFLSPIKITGRNGRPLKDIWSNAPHAYKGITVPDLPNFGILYGPNTNLSHNSLILVIEAQTRYLSVLIHRVLQATRGGQSLALCPSRERTLAYFRDVQSALQKTSFADPNCTSWWRRGDGTIVNNWAGTAVEYQKALASVEWADHHAFGSASHEVDMINRHAGMTKIGRVMEETRFSRTALGIFVLGVVGLLFQTVVLYL